MCIGKLLCFFFSSRRRHTRCDRDWSSDVCSSDLGGGYSTVEDLLAFANALQNHKLLDAEHLELLTTGKAERPDGSKYAYGFNDEISSDGVRCFGHGGGAPGMNGSLKICPQSGYVIAVLANLDPQAADRPATFVAARLPKQ